MSTIRRVTYVTCLYLSVVLTSSAAMAQMEAGDELSHIDLEEIELLIEALAPEIRESQNGRCVCTNSSGGVILDDTLLRQTCCLSDDPGLGISCTWNGSAC